MTYPARNNFQTVLPRDVCTRGIFQIRKRYSYCMGVIWGNVVPSKKENEKTELMRFSFLLLIVFPALFFFLRLFHFRLLLSSVTPHVRPPLTNPRPKTTKKTEGKRNQNYLDLNDVACSHPAPEYGGEDDFGASEVGVSRVFSESERRVFLPEASRL